MKNILHINSDFLYTNIYNLLYNEINLEVESQTVYSALKISEKELSFSSNKFNTILSPILNKSDSIFFRKRIKKTYNNLNSQINFNKFDVTHAHFLFTDGALALKIFEEYRIPYIVAVRNTDLNLYYKYFPHLKKIGEKIIFNAKKVIIISPSYKEKIIKYLSNKNILESKLALIPNGVDDFWIKNQSIERKNKIKNEIKFLFIGEITKNKNLKQTVGFLEKLSEYYKVKFTVIGKKLDGFKELDLLSKKFKWIHILPPIYNKVKLKNYYRDCDFFIMLSKTETFGLVFVESLTQGVPIIYTKGEGIDGYFQNGEVGYRIDIVENSFLDFKLNIKKMVESYDLLSKNCVRQSKSFNWNRISKKYINIYNQI